MAFNDAALVVGAEAITDLITHVSLHTTGAVSSSANESTAAREAVTWTVDGDGDATITERRVHRWCRVRAGGSGGVLVCVERGHVLRRVAPVGRLGVQRCRRVHRHVDHGDRHRVLMATFPGGIVALTNPTSGDDLADEVGGLTHSEQHADLNDEVEAVQAELGTTPSAGYATVKARMAALDARVFDVMDPTYGAAVDGSTNDTAAWQAAITAAGAAGGGIVTSSKAGVSVISGALQDTGGANSQLTLPSLHCMDAEQVTIVIRGPIAPPQDFSVIGATPLPDGHLVLKSTLASGTGSVLGGYGPSGSAGNFTNVHLRMHDIAVRTVANPTISALGLDHVACVDLERVTVDPGSYSITGLTEPTTSTSVGINLPAIANGAHSTVKDCAVIGFYTGVKHSEHASLDDVSVWGCKVGFNPVAANHASLYGRVGSYHCTTPLKFTGAHYLDVAQIQVEHAASGWAATTYDVDDASNYGKGFIRWQSVLAGVGDHNSFVLNGATGVTASRVGAVIGSSSTDTEAVQDIIGAMVAAAGGSYNDGAGTITLPSGTTVYEYRDRMVAAAGNNTLTLGATPVANSPLVWVNGTIKWPTTDYTISSGVITFNSGLSASDVVLVQYRSTASSASAGALSTAGGVSIADNFTRADSTSSLGSTSTGSLAWTQWSGTWGISSNQAYLSAAGSTNYAVVNTGVANVTASVKVSGTGHAGIVVRGGATISDFFLVEVQTGASYAAKIYRVVGGSTTATTTGSTVSAVAGDTVSVEVTSTTITAKLNGSTIATVTDSTHNTNTRQGLYLGTTGGRLDDFSVTS